MSSEAHAPARARSLAFRAGVRRDVWYNAASRSPLFVWCLAIPLVTFGSLPWSLERVPLARRSGVWRTALLAVLAAGAGIVLVLWLGFAADYPLTRSVYFTVAMLHVLVEFPFLLRLL